MSSGPIAQARAAFDRAPVSTTSGDRVCFDVDGRGYCGRPSKRRVGSWGDVVCSDCRAALRADEEAARG